MEKIFGMNLEVVSTLSLVKDKYRLSDEELIVVLNAMTLEEIYNKKMTMEMLGFWQKKMAEEIQESFDNQIKSLFGNMNE